MKTVTLPSGQGTQVWMNPCVLVDIGDANAGRALESAIHAALRDDSRYLFIWISGESAASEWKLAIQWGVGDDCRALPKLRLASGQRSPELVARSIRLDLTQFDEHRADFDADDSQTQPCLATATYFRAQMAGGA